MISFPNCKINIGLYVTGKRADGFHNIETIFYPVKEHYDVLEAVPAKEQTSLSITGLPIAGSEEENLVMKAWHMLHNDFPTQVGAMEMHLHKVMPMGAGLGGGSADGAFMLKMLDEMCALQLKERELLAYALRLGSDCPFFIRNEAQYAIGRGEQMEAIALNLENYTIKIETPGIHVSTSKAFAMMKPKLAGFHLKNLQELPIAEWRNHIGNDFEEVVFAMHPELAEIKQKMYNDGALYAQMSGSGSAVFGIF